MWRTLRSNRRPQKRPYTPHVVCAPTPSKRLTVNPSSRERPSPSHRVLIGHNAPSTRSVWSFLLVVLQYLCDRPLNSRQRHSTSPRCWSIARRVLPADHVRWHNRTATPIVMHRPEAEMQRVMRTNLLSLLSFRGTRQQECRRCDHCDSSIRTATVQKVTVSPRRGSQRVRRCCPRRPTTTQPFQRGGLERRQRHPRAPTHRGP
ncbi:hypothetical protein TcCL_NonESM08822 [Trypanosoma cruzi]|uniref:Uncharacterized protein n=1 Tax=Trypanosoma cruzi (strain CL Brener) TaxID=353153 RepID=Q4CSU7_TRYCC|nr:hypothetical protein Tc00.1047053508887.30 [Trypanosoma cruzi]EAN83350.1 hypothetical protein Tc00.1047053508887.30 [Trypanosoma cruzi]RNC41602.1 hypothetical protein TcCL_NonESM08822 [Trypanosoma cruzi]|eukprot:XP_805201.1 hypothetical protein [Trypanosoma cruzi strain CL Brener]